jgi:hypothetical protein
MNKRWVSLFGLLALNVSPAWAWTFAEGYSSSAPGASSRIFYRAFTLNTSQCARSPVPKAISIRLDRSSLEIGDRVHRNERSELIVEAYDAESRFLPAVPIIVQVLADHNVLGSRADWDYFEAISSGEGKVLVRWACGTPVVEGSVQVSVANR